MLQIALIGIAAGAASALLLASIASGSLLSVPLVWFAPLPVLIAALGWSYLAGLIAALIAALALGIVFDGLFALIYLAGITLPTWWLGYLALLGRPAEGRPGGIEWYPVGRLVAWAAVMGSLITSIAILTIATDAEQLGAALRKGFEAALREDANRPALRLLLSNPNLVFPSAIAVLTTLMTAFELWLAARIVLISGRLTRPWPDISAMTFPPRLLQLLAAALAGAFLLPGMAGVLALVLAASLLTAYALLGLAVLHALTRRLNGRGFILTSVYGAIAVFGWPMLLVALLGLVDMALDLRGRLPRPGPPDPQA